MELTRGFELQRAEFEWGMGASALGILFSSLELIPAIEGDPTSQTHQGPTFTKIEIVESLGNPIK